MKHSSRCLSLILLAAMLGGTVACGGGTAQDETTSGGESTESTTAVETNRLDELGDKDFTDKTLRIPSPDGGTTPNQNIPVDEENGDVINDALIKRDRYLTERFKFGIEYVRMTDNICQTFKNSILAGEREYDVIYSAISGGNLGTLAQEGMLANLCQFDVLSLDREWWSPLIYESCRIDDIMYYTAGDIAPSIYNAPSCIYMNHKLAKDYSIDIDSVYDSVKSGSWTIDLLGKLTKDLSQDLNDDGVLKADDDFFGMLNEPNSLSAAVFLAGAGVDLSTIDKNGSLTTNLGDEHTIDAIGKLKSVLTDAKYENLHSAFIGDRAIFMMHYVSSAYTRYRDMTSDFSIFPIPKYDENQVTYRSLVNTWSSSFVGVAVNATDEYVPFALEAMAWYSHENVRPFSYEAAFKQKGARDERDAEMLDMIFDTLYLDFNSFSNFGGSMDVLKKALFEDGSFASDWASIKDSTLAEMEKFAKTWTKSE